jgi:outer membrane PBP1 activator LpoA protein
MTFFLRCTISGLGWALSVLYFAIATENSHADTQTLSNNSSIEQESQAPYWLILATQAFNQNDFKNLEIYLKKMQLNGLTLKQKLVYYELSIQLFMAKDNDNKALKIVESTEFQDLMHQVKPWELASLKQTLALLDWNQNPKRSLEWLLEIAPDLKKNTDIQKNNDLIWDRLTSLDPVFFASIQNEIHQTEMGSGWLSLLSAWNQNTDQNFPMRQKNLMIWQSNWSDHPATKFPPKEITYVLAQAKPDIQKAGIALPLSGTLGQAGKPVLHGLLKYYYEQKLPIDFYFFDTEWISPPDILSRTEALQLNWLIGPLSKTDNQKLNKLPLPKHLTILSLQDGFQDSDVHNTSTPISKKIYRFTASIESEIRSIAIQAHQEGCQKATVIYSPDEIMKNLLNVFQSYWNALGQTEAETISTQKSETLNAKIKGLFPSSQPITSLDACFVLLTNPQYTASANLMLRYHSKTPINRYTTTLSFNPKQNLQDLEGLMLFEYPKILSQASLSQISNLNTKRLESFGADILPLLLKIHSQYLVDVFEGNSGQIHFDEQAKSFIREGFLSQFKNQKLEKLN